MPLDTARRPTATIKKIQQPQPIQTSPTTFNRVENPSKSLPTPPRQTQTNQIPKPVSIRDSQLRRGVNTLGNSSARNNPTNGVSYGRYPMGITDADVEGTAVIGKFVAGAWQQATGSNRINAPNPRIENMRQAFTPAEDLAYEAGRRFADGLKQTWDNKPTFQIPQVKIPEIKLPEIPKIPLPQLPQIKLPELPKIPELPQIKIPQTKLPPLVEPKPRPVKPGNLTERLEDEDFSECGGWTIYATDTFKRTILFVDQNGNTTGTNEPFPADEWLVITNNARIKEGYAPLTFNDYRLDGAGGEYVIINEKEIYLRYSQGSRLRLDGTRTKGGENQFLAFGTITFGSDNTDLKVGEAISFMISRFVNFEVYFFQANSNDPQCQLPPTIPPKENPPPNPPPKKCTEEDCMKCCENNEELLKLILRRIGPLPASVPNNLTKVNSGSKTIESLAEFISYSIVQANNQFGQFPQEIKIKDADLVQEGNQEKKVVLPNLAESIAEIIGILLILQSESNANLIATINSMIEAGSAKQAAIIASDYAAGNAEFLGYKGKQIEREVDFTFKPGEGQLSKMLQPSKVKVKSWDNADEKDFNDAILPLLELAAMYRAQNFRNIGTGNTLEKIRDLLKGASNISEEIDKLVKNNPQIDPDSPTQEPIKNEWDTFIEQAETGFIAKPGITDNTHPYGRPLEQRPKIREFGADTSEEPNAGQ